MPLSQASTGVGPDSLPGPVLQATALCKEVSSPEGRLTILDDVSFAVDGGASVAIVGPSGAGKSTLLSLLAGLDVPTSGTVRLCGVDLSTEDEDGRASVRARHVGFVFQSFHLLPSLTAIEQVMLPLELAGDGAARARAAAVLGAWLPDRCVFRLGDRTAARPHFMGALAHFGAPGGLAKSVTQTGEHLEVGHAR